MEQKTKLEKNISQSTTTHQVMRNLFLGVASLATMMSLNSCVNINPEAKKFNAKVYVADSDLELIVADDDYGKYYYKGYTLEIDATGSFDENSPLLLNVPIPDGSNIILLNEGFDATNLRNLGFNENNMLEYYSVLKEENDIATEVLNNKELKIRIKIDNDDLISKILLAKGFVTDLNLELFTADKRENTKYKVIHNRPLTSKYADVFRYNFLANFTVYNTLYGANEGNYFIWADKSENDRIFMLIDRQEKWSFFVPIYTDGDHLYNPSNKPEDAELIALPQFLRKIYPCIGPLKPVEDKNDLEANIEDWPEYGSQIYFDFAAKPTKDSHIIFKAPMESGPLKALITKSSFNATLTINDKNSLEAVIESIDIEHNYKKGLPVKIGIGDYSVDANVEASTAKAKIDNLEGKFVSPKESIFGLWYQLLDPDKLPLKESDFSDKKWFEYLYKSGFTIYDWFRPDNILNAYIGYVDDWTFTFAGGKSQKYNLSLSLTRLKYAFYSGYLELIALDYNEEEQKVILDVECKKRPEAVNYIPFLYNKYYIIFDHGKLKLDIYPKYEEYGKKTWYLYKLKPGEYDRIYIDNVDSEEAEKIFTFFDKSE